MAAQNSALPHLKNIFFKLASCYMPYVHDIGCLCVKMPSVLSLLNKQTNKYILKHIKCQWYIKKQYYWKKKKLFWSPQKRH